MGRGVHWETGERLKPGALRRGRLVVLASTAAQA